MCSCNSIPKLSNRSEIGRFQAPVYINTGAYNKGYNNDLKDGIYEHLLFVIFADPQETIDAFNKSGVELNLSNRQEKFKTARDMAAFALRADDINGKLIGEDGKPVYFNTADIIKSINITMDELRSSPIQFTDNNSSSQ